MARSSLGGAGSVKSVILFSVTMSFNWSPVNVLISPNSQGNTGKSFPVEPLFTILLWQVAHANHQGNVCVSVCVCVC